MSDKAKRALGKRGLAHQCSKCTYIADKQQMIRHVVTNHLPRSEAPFSCGSCNKITLREEEMKKHMDDKHPGLESTENMGGTRTPYLLKSEDASALTKEKSLIFYGGRSTAVQKGDPSEPESSVMPPLIPIEIPLTGANDAALSLPGCNMGEVLEVFRQYPKILDQVNGIIELRHAVESISTEEDPNNIILDTNPHNMNEVTHGPESKTEDPAPSTISQDEDDEAMELHVNESEVRELLEEPVDLITPINSPVKAKTSVSLTPKENNVTTETALECHPCSASCVPVAVEAVRDIVRQTVQETLTAVGRQPIAPEQDLRPITNQLMTTNVNLSQVAGILQANNSKNSELSCLITDLTKSVSGLTCELSRVNRAATIISEAAVKLDQGVTELTGTLRSLYQGTIDSHANLTTAMKQQAGGFRFIRNNFIGITDESGQMKQILKLDEPSFTIPESTESAAPTPATSNSTSDTPSSDQLQEPPETERVPSEPSPRKQQPKPQQPKLQQPKSFKGKGRPKQVARQKNGGFKPRNMDPRWESDGPRYSFVRPWDQQQYRAPWIRQPMHGKRPRSPSQDRRHVMGRGDPRRKNRKNEL